MMSCDQRDVYAVQAGYVARESDDYLKCGRLESEFLRVRCESCHHEKLVALSGKKRGLLNQANF
jgi:hypothetical protein